MGIASARRRRGASFKQGDIFCHSIANVPTVHVLTSRTWIVDVLILHVLTINVWNVYTAKVAVRAPALEYGLGGRARPVHTCGFVIGTPAIIATFV